MFPGERYMHIKGTKDVWLRVPPQLTKTVLCVNLAKVFGIKVYYQYNFSVLYFVHDYTVISHPF